MKHPLQPQYYKKPSFPRKRHQIQEASNHCSLTIKTELIINAFLQFKNKYTYVLLLQLNLSPHLMIFQFICQNTLLTCKLHVKRKSDSLSTNFAERHYSKILELPYLKRKIYLYLLINFCSRRFFIIFFQQQVLFQT